MALNRSPTYMSFRFFIIPLLISGLPNLSLAALPTSKRLVEIKLRQAPICVDVRKLAVVGRNRRRMIPLLNQSEVQNSLSLAQLLLAGVSAGLHVRAHVRIAA
jgi:hypothetical protein